MTLIQLRYFLSACRQGSFTKAAEEMHVTQPSISSALQELEKDFNVTLFNRDSKKLVLTREGEILKEHAIQLVEQADTVRQLMCDLGNIRNKINLGVPPMIGTFLFPALYSSFKKEYPNIEICSREGGLHELLKLLEKRELDLAILPSNQISDLEYHTAKIMQTETVFCVSSEHPLAEKPYVEISDIANEPLIMFKGGFYQNELILRKYKEAGHMPQVIHTTSQFYTIRELSKAELASGFMFRNIVESEDHIVGIPFKDPLLVNISLVWPKNGYLYNDTTKMIEFVKNYKNSIP